MLSAVKQARTKRYEDIGASLGSSLFRRTNEGVSHIEDGRRKPARPPSRSKPSEEVRVGYTNPSTMRTSVPKPKLRFPFSMSARQLRSARGQLNLLIVVGKQTGVHCFDEVHVYVHFDGRAGGVIAATQSIGDSLADSLSGNFGNLAIAAFRARRIRTCV